MASLLFGANPALSLGSSGIWWYTTLGPDLDSDSTLADHIRSENPNRAAHGDPLVACTHHVRAEATLLDEWCPAIILQGPSLQNGATTPDSLLVNTRYRNLPLHFSTDRGVLVVSLRVPLKPSKPRREAMGFSRWTS